ncbi:MAG: FHA domain-containing protein [Gemmataceae bacterium]|nr:FHA domain-containing protein [Gemmata sp.]MDW8198813.1 FHA domain-containing protein [Gemmataceae bacterium]
MGDPRLHSVHLEGQPRRESFRAARAALQATCGSLTIAADRGSRHNPPPNDASTVHTTPPSGGQVQPSPHQGAITCYLKEGVNVYPLHLGMNSIGRLPDNDVVIRDECISRRHCAIVVHSDLRCELHDIASKNGTHLNGKKIPGPTRLQSGDRITLCNRHFIFQIAEIAPPPALGKS